MNFLAPLAFAFSALSIPIILLYMLRLRRTEKPISSSFLWKHLVRDREANAPWQRLRFSWLLLLQLLILLALVLALARPFVEVQTVSAGQIVLLLDASASMNATDMGDSRFERAKEQALDLVGTLGGDDTMTVIRVADVPEVLASSSRNRSELRDAINDAQAGETAADWTAAMTLAASRSQLVEDLQVVIVSDGGLPADLPEIPGEIRLVTVGESSENLAISALATRDIPGSSPQLFAQITNYGTQDSEVIFSIELNGELFSAQRYTVAAQDHADVIVPNLPLDFGTLRAVLSPPAAATVPDYLALDNEAYAVQEIRSAGEVLLVTERNIFLTQIFGSLPGVRLTQARPDSGLPAGEFDLYVFDGWLPDTLPDGDLFIINPPSSTGLFTVGAAVEDINQARAESVLPDNPLTQYLDFADVNISTFRPISDYESWGQSLVTSRSGNPLLLAGEVDGRQAAVLSFALQDSDLPLQLTYPIMMANLIQWYTPPRFVDVASQVAPGTALVLRPLDGNTVQVTMPNEDDQTFSLSDSVPQALFAETRQTGVYRVDVKEGDEILGTEYFAVNLFDAGESDITPRDSVIVGTTEIAESSREETGQRELWQYLALLGLAILLLEWMYYHRGNLRQLAPAGRRAV
jgi:Ca-activated chloride channel homolog